MATNVPEQGDSVIDSRDVIARLEELQDELDLLEDEEEIQDWHDENDEEYLPLKALNDECEGYSDWKHGETLISRDYWVDYCRELCQDIGDLPKEIPHYIVIDWEATASNLEADYTEVSFGDCEYLIRNC